ICGYIFGGAWLGLCAGMLAAMTAANLIDANSIQRTIAGLHAAISASSPMSTAATSMDRFDTASFRGAATVLLAVGALIWLATVVWCVVAWGAFRRSFAVPRWRAWLATSIWIALVAAIVWLPLQLA
ncbi:MAG TPA: hypothetical protein VLD35_13555, partial [Caldimonas sp.]|nr:hypothetical protein [Caldimonas sp.]